MPMGQIAGPAIWQPYMNTILGNIPDRLRCLTIMDDLQFQSSKHRYLKFLEDPLRALLKNGLK